MKKGLLVLASLFMVLSVLAGCGNGDNDVPPTDDQPGTEQNGPDGTDNNDLGEPNGTDNGGDMGTGDETDTGNDMGTDNDTGTDMNNDQGNDDAGIEDDNNKDKQQ